MTIEDEIIKEAFKNCFLEYDESIVEGVKEQIARMEDIFNWEDIIKDEPDFYNIKTITLNANSDFSESEDYGDNESETNTVIENAPIFKSQQIIFANDKEE